MPARFREGWRESMINRSSRQEAEPTIQDWYTPRLPPSFFDTLTQPLRQVHNKQKTEWVKKDLLILSARKSQQLSHYLPHCHWTDVSNQAPGSTQKSLKGWDDEWSCGELEQFWKGLGEMAQISHRGQCCNHQRVNKESRLHFRCDKDNQECRPNRCDKATHFNFFFLFSSFCVQMCVDKALSSIKLKRKDLISLRLHMTHTWTGARGVAPWLKCTCAQLVHFFFSCPCWPPTPLLYCWTN